jgi:hypothetical protein
VSLSFFSAEIRPEEGLMFQQLAESPAQAGKTSGEQRMQNLNGLP